MEKNYTKYGKELILLVTEVYMPILLSSASDLFHDFDTV